MKQTDRQKEEEEKKNNKRWVINSKNRKKL
jgi:hypothetical protein